MLRIVKLQAVVNGDDFKFFANVQNYTTKEIQCILD